MNNEIESNRKNVVSLANLLSDSTISSSHQVINGLLGSKQKLMITAPPKSCKTSLAVNLAVSIGLGNKWLDYSCTIGNVLYINADTTDETLYQRFIDVRQSSSQPDKELKSIDILSFKNGYRQNTVDELVNTIMDAIGDHKYSLVIIDSLDYFVSFEYSNNGSTFGPVINQALDLIASRTGASIAFTLKDDYSHVFEGLCDTYMELVPVTSERLKAAGIEQGDYYQVDIKSSVFAIKEPSLFKFEYPSAKRSNEKVPSIEQIKEINYRDRINRNRKKRSKDELDEVFSELSIDGDPVEIGLIADRLGIHIKSAYRKVKAHPDYETIDGLVNIKKQ